MSIQIGYLGDLLREAEAQRDQFKARLERCEAALQGAYGFLGRLVSIPRNTNWAGEKWDTTLPEEMKKEAWTIMQKIADVARTAREEK